MEKSCPRCGMVRQLPDLMPPEYCPKCGLVYDRFVPEPAVGAEPMPRHRPGPNAPHRPIRMGLVWAIVGVGLAIPAIGILAAIAIPTILRSRAATDLIAPAVALEHAVDPGEGAARSDPPPRPVDFPVAGVYRGVPSGLSVADQGEFYRRALRPEDFPIEIGVNDRNEIDRVWLVSRIANSRIYTLDWRGPDSFRAESEVYRGGWDDLEAGLTVIGRDSIEAAGALLLLRHAEDVHEADELQFRFSAHVPREVLAQQARPRLLGSSGGDAEALVEVTAGPFESKCSVDACDIRVDRDLIDFFIGKVRSQSIDRSDLFRPPDVGSGEVIGAKGDYVDYPVTDPILWEIGFGRFRAVYPAELTCESFVIRSKEQFWHELRVVLHRDGTGEVYLRLATAKQWNGQNLVTDRHYLIEREPAPPSSPPVPRILTAEFLRTAPDPQPRLDPRPRPGPPPPPTPAERQQFMKGASKRTETIPLPLPR